MLFFILPIDTWTNYNIGPLPQNSGTDEEIRGQTGEFPISSKNYLFGNREFTRLTPNFEAFSAIIFIFEGDSMANHPSALKRYRQNQRRRLVNQMNRHKLKTQIKRLRAAIAAGKGADAKPLLPATFSIIDQSVQKGVIKKNTARRYKSRLAKRVNGLPA